MPVQMQFPKTNSRGIKVKLTENLAPQNLAFYMETALGIITRAFDAMSIKFVS